MSSARAARSLSTTVSEVVVQSWVYPPSLRSFITSLTPSNCFSLASEGDAPVELPQRVRHLPRPPSGQPQVGHRRHAPGVVRVHRSEPAVTRGCCDPLWGHGRTRHALRTDHGRPPALQSFFCFNRSARFFFIPRYAKQCLAHPTLPTPSQHPCATSRTTDPTPLPSRPHPLKKAIPHPVASFSEFPSYLFLILSRQASILALLYPRFVLCHQSSLSQEDSVEGSFRSIRSPIPPHVSRSKPNPHTHSFPHTFIS